MPVKGRKVPAVAIVSKNGLLFVLDRVSGKPLLPVEERAFPASDVPGEAAAPTQKVPVATPPLARTTFAPGDVADLTPELKRGCSDWIAKNDMKAGALYVPVGFNRVTISFPGLQGGANWGGASFDPGSGLLLVNTSDLGQVTSLIPSNGPLPYERGPVSGRFQLEGTKLMCQAPPWGRLSAVDVATGKMLWETKLEAAAHATPITYSGRDGRQFVAVTSTGGSFLDSPLASDTITAFALPRENN